MRLSQPLVKGAKDLTLGEVAIEMLNRPRQKPLRRPDIPLSLMHSLLAQCPWDGGANIRFYKVTTAHCELWLIGGKLPDGTHHPGPVCIDPRKPDKLGKPVLRVTFNQYLFLVKQIFRFGVKQRYRRDNPMADAEIDYVDPPKDEETKRLTASRREFLAIVKFTRAHKRNRFREESALFIEFMGYFGLGAAEVASLIGECSIF